MVVVLKVSKQTNPNRVDKNKGKTDISSIRGMKQVMTTLPADIRNRKRKTRNNSTHIFDSLDGKNQFFEKHNLPQFSQYEIKHFKFGLPYSYQKKGIHNF